MEGLIHGGAYFRNFTVFRLSLFCFEYCIKKKQDPHRGRLITCGHTMPGHEGVYCIVSDGKLDCSIQGLNIALSGGYLYGEAPTERSSLMIISFI